MPKNIWETLWDYDPNGLVVVDKELKIKVINPAFLKMFYLENEDIIGRFIFEFFDDVSDFEDIIKDNKKVIKHMKEYPSYNLITSEIAFAIDGNDEEMLIAKIFHDISEYEKKDKELRELKFKIIDEVQKIVDKQMKTGQEIASILGETTAETKASLMKLLSIIKKEN
ncbi:PAS domain S-box-containing protein [Marinitoga hydrogenitolerans DSM 16785]|uniref:PAS domain S-box-containing protein n=1 Tax=Marinitoga hydrogenitolerans (strain DSM 16785 / JCM 12826 / AT1271) TaxID=1122195 RepID=A0A1M4SZP1_MARH1|nr:PAS domain-containing protein [Marinitoga hydrogenitolerans]SHE37645.1 PAS domain S-box-containing protein [Marinitoga hydrogenitolerans DSM 16785]